MKLAKFSTVTLFCLLACVSAIRAEASSQQREVKSPSGAAIRSALLPGWGQFYNRKPLKGSLLFCADSFLLTQIILGEREAHTGASHRQRRNTLILWWAGVRLYAIIDAYVDAQLYNLDKGEIPLSFSFASETGTDRITLIYRYCF